MSYKTNPITNRFNINKGWINANFPENLSFYARDNVFFFKLYLFLKTYFTLRNIKLISCQIRIGQDHRPVLYLIINTTTTRKKKRSTSTFRHLWPTKRAGFKYSPLRNPWNVEALTLMFFDLAKLKKIFKAQLLPLSKQKPSPFWLTKPRLKTWVNFLTKVRKCRTQSIRSRHIKNFHPNRVQIFKYQIQSSLEFKFSRAMKEFLLLTKILKVITHQQHVTPQTLTFYKQRLKTISQSINTIHSVLSKIQQRRKIQKKRKLRLYQKARAKRLILQFQHKQLKFFHQILKKSRFYRNNWNSMKLPIRKKNRIFHKFWRANPKRSKRRKRKVQKLILAKPWTKKTKFRFITNQTSLKKFMLQLLTLRLKMDQFSQTNRLTVFHLLQIHQKWFSDYHISGAKSPKTKALRNQLIHHLLKKKPRLKTKKLVRPLLLQQFQQLRQKKKNQLTSLDRTTIISEVMTNYRWKSKSAVDFQKKRKVLPKTHAIPNRTRTYRQSFRMSYKKHLNLLVRYQYKLWLQKVLHLFFQTRFEVKFTQPLAQFKNLKFLRLVYPIPTFLAPNQIELANAKQNGYAAEEKFLGKRYVYLGTRLKRLKTFKKKIRKTKIKKIKTKNKTKTFSINTYPFQKKADLFKRSRRKKLRDYAQKRLGSIKHQLLMREFVPTLSLFIKYLNPQILADHIAKEFEKTKKHRKILFALKTALRSLKFARGIGYRIAIVGRINSSTKSRAFYLTKKNLIRQNFSKKINYATAQAKARIGSFGIKVWLFY